MSVIDDYQALPEEVKNVASTIGGEVLNAITDTPAQVELLARCVLATKFIQVTPAGPTFHPIQFEKVWRYLTGESGQTGQNEPPNGQ